MKYNKKADKFLKDFYVAAGAKTWKQKYNLLEMRLDIVPGTQSFSHNPTWRQKVGMMEYEFLERNELIEVTYV